MAVTSFAYTGREAIEFFKRYKPFTNVADDMIKICPTYAVGIFYDAKLDDIYYSEINDSTYTITTAFHVGNARPDMLTDTSSYIRNEIQNVKGKLRLEWRVDMRNRTVRPYNTLAEDCLTLFADMVSILGVRAIRK